MERSGLPAFAAGAWILSAPSEGVPPTESELPPKRWAPAANRPLNWNALGVSGGDPDGHERQLEASTTAAERGATVLALTVPHLLRLRLSLETGSWAYFDPARRLYSKHGFVECPPFADYVLDPNSVFMSLELK